MEVAAVWDNATHNHTERDKNKLEVGGGFGYPWLVSKYLGKVFNNISLFAFAYCKRFLYKDIKIHIVSSYKKLLQEWENGAHNQKRDKNNLEYGIDFIYWLLVSKVKTLSIMWDHKYNRTMSVNLNY